MDWKSVLADLWENYRGRTIGLLAGLIVGVLFLTLGFFKTIFLMICIGVGCFIGDKADNQEDLFRLIEKIWPKKYY